MFPLITYTWILLVSGYAAWTDIQTRTISNTLIGFGFGGVILWQLIHLSLNWESFIIGVFISFSLWAFKLIGGGDSKLLIVVSLALPLSLLLTFYTFMSLIGALQASLALLKKKDSVPYAVAIFGGFIATLIYSFITA